MNDKPSAHPQFVGVFVLFVLAGCGGSKQAAVTDEPLVRQCATIDTSMWDNGPSTAYLAPPSYPGKAKKAEQTGDVIVRVTISSTGAATAAKICKSSGFALLDSAAIKAIRFSRFEPALANGEGVESEMDIPYSFRMN